MGLSRALPCNPLEEQQYFQCVPVLGSPSEALAEHTGHVLTTFMDTTENFWVGTASNGNRWPSIQQVPEQVSLSFCLPSRNHSTPAADIKNKRQYSDETEAPLIMKDIKASRIEFNSPFDGDRMIYSNGERRIRLLQSINLDFLKRLLHKELFEQVLDKVY